MTIEDRAIAPSTIGALLAARARRDPDRVFLSRPGSPAVTFGQMQEAASELGAQLKALGLEPGDRVAVLLPNGFNLAVSLLAIMGAGGVAVPLNNRLKPQELVEPLRGTSPRFALTEGEPEALAAGPFEASVPFAFAAAHDSEALRVAPRRGGSPAPRAMDAHGTGSEAPALILHTSGSTGRPKGAVLTHRNLLANADQVVRAHRLDSTDVALCVLPLFHINGFVVTLLAPLLSGGSVVVPRRFEASAFWGWAEAHRVTWFSGVPTILSRLLSEAPPPREVLARLRFARSASAPLPVAVMEAFEARFGVPVIESMGMTEAAGQVTSNPLPPARRKPGSVGISFGNGVRVVDEAGQPVGPGITGEVTIAGEAVFGGYLDRPEADREALRGGWLFTGDLGHLDEEGFLFLTGRRKEIINRAGEKIAPREVEEVLHRLPAVETACAVGVPDPIYGEEVAAFLSVRAGQVLEAAAVTAFCREHLASFKVPKKVFFVDEFPRGPNGKLLRRGLIDLYRRLEQEGG